MASRMANVIYQGAQALWLLVLILAPWLYGGTRAWTVDWLNALGAGAVILWLGGCLLEWRRPRLPWPAALTLLGLLAYGWCLALNPHLEYRADFFTFVLVSPRVPWLPGGVDGATAMRQMTRISVLCGGLWLVSDLSAGSAFRRQLWVTVGLTGASIALFGIAQRAFQNPLWLWSAQEFVHTQFAGFRYHANAGAYLNLVWPLLMGLVVMAFRSGGQDLARTVWMGALGLSFSALFVNISKAALVVSGLLLVGMGVWAWRVLSRDWEQEWNARWRRWIFGAALILGTVLILLTWDRWKAGGAQSADGRWLAYQVSWKMVRATGAVGLGPGTWALAFPFYSRGVGEFIPGVWLFAHEDYLQTLVEWGWVATLGWAVVILGGLGLGFSSLWRRDELRTRDRTLLFGGCLAVSGVLLHALVDFPLQIASIQIYVATFLGLAWGSRRWGALERPLGAPPRHDAE